MQRLLLISNTYQHGMQPLAHCLPAVSAHFSDCKRVIFVGYAQHDQEEYVSRMRAPFDQLGVELVSAHTGIKLSEAQGIFVGGGNTFLLVKKLYDRGWISEIKQAVSDGMPYMGTSAGSNIAAPTLCTTNDMPIVEPESFRTLGLVPFQINPHYLDPNPNSTHMGESTERRIAEYHQQQSLPVLGLREGSWLTVVNDRMFLRGANPARLFRVQGAEEIEVNSDLSSLLCPQ